jgi:hypothetical protein
MDTAIERLPECLMVILNPMSFNNSAISAVLEIYRCTLVAIDASNPAVTGNFSSAYLLQTKGAFLEFCRKTVGAHNRRVFRHAQLSVFATDCPLLRFKQVSKAFPLRYDERQMEVEKTIAFILDQQAKTEALWQRNEERWKRAEVRVDRFDKSLDGLRKLVATGMKMLNRATVERRAMEADIRDLVAAQKRTDQKFERLVELLSRRSPNGRH